MVLTPVVFDFLVHPCKLWKYCRYGCVTMRNHLHSFFGFFSGQLKLMMAGEWCRDWATFLRMQYVGPIDRLFSLGAKVVVLSFGLPLFRLQIVFCIMPLNLRALQRFCVDLRVTVYFPFGRQL